VEAARSLASPLRYLRGSASAAISPKAAAVPCEHVMAIVQEALTNVRKHVASAAAAVRLSYTSGGLDADITKREATRLLPHPRAAMA
jgi:hypothetical protein